MEYVKKAASSTTSKAALGLGIAGTALGILNGGANILNPGGALFGARPVAYGGYGVPPVAFAPAAVDGCCGNGYVTEKEMRLIREGSEKDAVIGQLTAEKYANNLVDCKVAPLNARICELETATAVNAARDHDFRRYVEREFVHQPKAKINESIVTCKQCGCGCGCDCGHDHF